MKRKLLLPILIGFLLVQGCVIIYPKFTTIDKVITIKPGMTFKNVSETLGIQPYDFIVIENGEKKMIYKYRVYDRKIPKDLMEPNNGKDLWGALNELIITFDSEDKVVKIEATNENSEKKNKIINK